MYTRLQVSQVYIARNLSVVTKTRIHSTSPRVIGKEIIRSGTQGIMLLHVCACQGYN